MGVAGSLAVANQAFDLHDADWQKLAVGPEKDMDFWVASDGNRHIVVESKGSVVDNVLLKESGVSGHKSDIKGKKAVQRPKRPRDCLIGTITAIPSNNSRQPARVWLVDPPQPDLDIDPHRFKVLTRLRYYRNVLAAVGRPHLLIALANRIKTLENSVAAFKDLDGLPLVNADGEPFSVPASFSQQRSHSLDDSIVVATQVLHESGLLLVGIDLTVIPIIVNQEFRLVAGWRSRRRSRGTRIFRLSLSPVEIAAIAPQRGTPSETPGRRWLRALCDVSISASGLVWGIASSDSVT
jgi:hypothetical protein